jgi:hypothetical protein
MILFLAVIAVFLAGIVIGSFAMVVIGIHAEQRRSAHVGAQANTRIGAASRRFRLVGVRVTDASDAERHEDGR